jgi:cyclohexa-1,5-dienecarbonyl-CoA hydratase
MPSGSPLKIWIDRDGALLRLRLARPKANLVDAAMIRALREAFAIYRGKSGILAALLDAEGPHFSFGASVEEHLPDQAAGMLAALHKLIVEMLEWPVPVLVAVRGQCLGGGLELAIAGSLIFVASDSKLGQPEIALAVFAPAASCLLPPRIGQAAAEELLFSGRTIDGIEAKTIGLATNASEDPEAAALAWFDRNLARHSAAALGCAIVAARGSYVPDVKRRLAEVEKIYLERTLESHDAIEGLHAFIEKRVPEWKHR